jgi:hypothetical protein
MQDRKPRFAWRIEASRSNLLKLASRGLLAILAVDVKKLRHARRVTWDHGQVDTSQPMSQRVPNSREALWAESRHRRESPIMSRCLEICEGFEAQFVVEPIGEHSANSRHWRQERYRVGFAAQAVQHRQSSVRHQLTNWASDAFAYVRQLLQTVKPSISKYFIYGRLHRTDAGRRA